MKIAPPRNEELVAPLLAYKERLWFFFQLLHLKIMHIIYIILSQDASQVFDYNCYRGSY